jgi:hypothetical protein
MPYHGCKELSVSKAIKVSGEQTPGEEFGLVGGRADGLHTTGNTNLHIGYKESSSKRISSVTRRSLFPTH